MTAMTATLFDPFPVQETVLPDLKGSPAQIPWATAVRAGKLKKCREHLRQWKLLMDRYRDVGRDDAADRELEGYEAAVAMMERLEAETACRWWLDRRLCDAGELLSGAPAKPGNSYEAVK